jgi:hypothetical protein
MRLAGKDPRSLAAPAIRARPPRGIADHVRTGWTSPSNTVPHTGMSLSFIGSTT